MGSGDGIAEARTSSKATREKVKVNFWLWNIKRTAPSNALPEDATACALSIRLAMTAPVLQYVSMPLKSFVTSDSTYLATTPIA